MSYSFLKKLAGLKQVGGLVKKVKWSTAGNVVSLILGVVDRVEYLSHASEAAGEKLSGADKLRLAFSTIDESLPAIEVLVGDRFNDEKVQAAKAHLIEAYVAFQNALRDAKGVMNDGGVEPEDVPLSE